MSTSKTEKEFLETYNMREYEPVSLTVDLALFTIKQGELCILMVERGGHPFKGCWALPGGFVDTNETLDEAVRRELEEETSIILEETYIEQLKTYASPSRDPRGYVASVVFVALAPIREVPRAGDDARKAVFLPVEEVLNSGRLAFDHEEIIRDAKSFVEYRGRDLKKIVKRKRERRAE